MSVTSNAGRRTFLLSVAELLGEYQLTNWIDIHSFISLLRLRPRLHISESADQYSNNYVYVINISFL